MAPIAPVGMVLAALGLSLMAEGWSECLLARQAGQLATQGLHAVTRHPRCSGAIFALLGLAMTMLPLANAVLAVAPMALAAVWLAQREDRQLFARFGESYRAYRIRVAACVPRRVRWRPVLASLASGS